MGRVCTQADVEKMWELLFFSARNSLNIHNDDSLMKIIQETKSQAITMFQNQNPLAEYNWVTKLLLEKFPPEKLQTPETLNKFLSISDPKLFELQLARLGKNRGLVKMKNQRPTFIMDGFIEYIKEGKKEKDLLAQIESVPNQLNTNLKHGQISKLFEFLIKDKFITDTTDNESFLWALGCDKIPEHWQPIKWNEAKQGLRELLAPILGTITNQHIRDIEKLFLDRKNNPFKMNKSTTSKDEVSARYGDISKIIETLNLD